MARDEKKRKKPKLLPPSPTSSSPRQPLPAEQGSGDYNENKTKKKKHSKKEGQQKARTQEIYDDDNDNDVEKTGEEEDEENNNRDNGMKKKKKKSLITDSRFAAAHFDPRFQRMPKRESKVVIDSRFTRMFSDKNFEPSAAPVDKRGKRKREKAVNPLLHYYLHQEDKEEEEGQLARVKETIAEVESERDVSAEEDEENGSEDDDMEKQSSAASTSDENSSTDDEDFDDDESVKSELYKYLLASHEDTPVTDTETHRLAVVNMDWNHIKAVDLYVVMSSCLPKGGQILSVTIYPSEFGLKCMDIEATRGPFGLFNESNEDSGDDSDIGNEKIRSYELNKLRYYYAVAICDSIATASYIYKSLDGTELLETSNVFDLRFVPDSMEFKHPPHDVATEAPVTYKEPDFQTCALQHTNVKLTWEEDEPERKRSLRRKFNLDQLDELNIYLASSEGSDEDDGNDEENNDEASPIGKVKKRKGVEELRSLLLSGNDSDGDKSDEKDMEKDMEITFNTELEDLSKRILEKKDKKSETVWETVIRKRSEKKKARKWSKHSDDDGSDYDDAEEAPDQTDDFFVEEPSDTENKVGKKKSKSSSKKRRKDDKDNNDLQDLDKEQEASRAELELLLADEQGPRNGPKGYNIKKNKKGKDKKGKEVPIEDKLPDVDVSTDPRFSALFKSHLFALDPTDPQYKRSAAFVRQRAAVKQEKGAREADIPQKAAFDTLEQDIDDVPAKDGVVSTAAVADDKNFFATVRSLKRNVGTLKNQSKGRKH